MARKTKEEAEQTKNTIMDAALKMFCTKGYSRTTFDDIAASINLTKGAIYWHFKNKADLLAEMILIKFKRYFKEVEEQIPSVKTLKELRSVYTFMAERIIRDPEHRKYLFFTMFQMEWSEGMVNKIEDAIQEIRDIPFKCLRGVLGICQESGEIRKDVNLDELTIMIMYMWRGAISFEISGLKVNNFPDMVGKSFDAIMASKKVERS